MSISMSIQCFLIFERELFLRDSPGFERLSFSRESMYMKMCIENG